MSKPHFARPIYIVDGLRTPQLKARGKPNPFTASDLAVQACRALLAKQPFAPTDLGEVVTACMMPNENEANIARIIALRLGCGNAMPAYTVQRNCGAGLQAIDSAALDIAAGRYELVLAGGTEAMSRAPLLFNPKMVNWLADWNGAKDFVTKIKVLAQFRPNYLAPVIALLYGLSDPVVNLSMGQTAEKLAYQFNITREEMDKFAWISHQRVASAQDKGYFAQEITPLYDNAGNCYTADDGIRRDTTLEKLAALKPSYEKPFGLVTAGNSSQVTDGAAFVILASETAVEKYKLPVLGRIIDISWKALDPSVMGLGPVYASTALLRQQQLTMSDIDYWEINEAFATQVLACLAAWQDADFCKRELGLDAAFGKIDPARLNVDGGGVALGHPVAASGARITLHLLNVLKRMKAKRGVATMCIGGGQGGAVLIENI
jgi:acetyl-CoA C-acetyltransferase